MNAITKAETLVNSTRRRPNKFHAKATYVGSLRFHSKGESERWQQLELLQRGGQITGLRRQVPFNLLAWTPSGPEIIGIYTADFQYRDLKTNQETVEDFKGMVTAEFRRTQKIMLANYGIEILVTHK